jgi:hypothetical protein
MYRFACYFVCSAALVGLIWAGLSSTSCGQPPAPKVATVSAATALPSVGPYRKLVPGVMQKVNPQRELEETFDVHDMVELLAVDKTFDWAKDVTFRRDIWFLSFEFKPVRYIEVDIPQADGHMQRKLIRYLVYNVTNPGQILHVVTSDAEKADYIAKWRAACIAKGYNPPDELEWLSLQEKEKAAWAAKGFNVTSPYRSVLVMPVNKPVKFVPQFSLESQDDSHNVYPDHVMPMAMIAIRQREDPNRVFLNTVEMTREIPVGQTFWGIATWEDIDPKITHYSIFVNGLTNAYRFTDDPGVYKVGDPIGKGRHLTRKTLKLNFWKPGDPYLEHEEEVRYGIPGEVDYEWLYR